MRWFSVLLFLSLSARAAQESCSVPLIESESAPAIDLIEGDRVLDRDEVLERIQKGIDSSRLEPMPSSVYSGSPQEILGARPCLNEGESVDFQRILAGTSGLVRARVNLHSDPTEDFQLNLSLDTHAALVRNALLRKLGYGIPEPRYCQKIKVTFSSDAARDLFLDTVSSETLTARSRWISGGHLPDAGQTTLELQDVVLEPALIEVPQFHWGILTAEALASRRSLRALLVPLTLIEIPESVNLYSIEAAKIFNQTLVFSRPGAAAFLNETSIGDVRWILRKIARINREEWSQIIAAGRYPKGLEALLVEKTLARVNRLMEIVSISDFQPFTPDLNLSQGSVVNGKVTQETYDGYALRFAYGDPKSPLRASELFRYFGIAGLNGLLGGAINQANRFLVAVGPETYIQKHQEKLLNDVLTHYQNHPNEPYVQPLQIWGGPTLNGSIQASRNVMTGTYFGSNSQIQLVDVISAGASVGGFFGVSGIPNVGGVLAPGVQATRSYVHVRPLPDLKTAWKDSWIHLWVPGFMKHLAKLLNGEGDPGQPSTVQHLMEALKPGEMLIVNDTLIAGATIGAQVPLGALIGFLPSFGTLSASASIGGHYGIISRTTLMRTEEGLQVLLQRARSEGLDLSMDARFFIKLVGLDESIYGGTGHTQAFLFSEKPDSQDQDRKLSKDLEILLSRNCAEPLQEDFKPFELDHRVKGNRFRFSIGPYSWVRRLNFHRLKIQHPAGVQRTVIEGQLTRVRGSDSFGFFGTLTGAIHPLLQFGQEVRGDDPSSNFLGRSRTLTFSTQVEITPDRNHAPFVKIEESWSGWSLKRNRFLRLIRTLSDRLRKISPGADLIPEEEFSQVRKIQAWKLSWSLILYRGAVEKVVSEVQKTGADFSSALDEDRAKEEIRNLNGWVSRLTRKMGLSQFIEWVGRDQVFLQAHVSGFRVNDESGDSDYFSNTIGKLDPKQWGGPFSELSVGTQISSHEIEARYLSNGF